MTIVSPFPVCRTGTKLREKCPEEQVSENLSTRTFQEDSFLCLQERRLRLMTAYKFASDVQL